MATKYFMDTDIEEHDLYRSLEYFAKYKSAFLQWMHELIRQRRGRNLKTVYYDVTNYYFECETEDAIRKSGFSKEQRTSPIVQMGLLMDNDGIPISYRLFPGNTPDCHTMMPVLHELKDEFNLGRIIVVADRGINSGKNIGYHRINKNGYILSQSILKSTQEVKDYILDPNSYQQIGVGFKSKSRLVTTQITVTDIHGKKKKVDVDQKRVVIYSEKYAARAKHLRDEQLAKAEKNIAIRKTKPARGSYGYIDETTYAPDTGEILSLPKALALAPPDKAEEQAKFDGYYLLVTSELKMSDAEVLDHYKGLWKIEDAFRITKSELETRPIYLQNPEHIEAHFLTCFTALTLLRLMKQDLKDIPTPVAIQEMKRMRMFPVTTSTYALDYNSPVIEQFSKICGVEFGLERITRAQLRSMIASLKRHE